MTKGQLNKFTNLGHLFSASTDIIVADISKIGFFIFTLDGISL